MSKLDELEKMVAALERRVGGVTVSSVSPNSGPPKTETPLETPRVFLTANDRATDDEDMTPPAIMLATNVQDMSLIEAITTIAEQAGLSDRDRKRLLKAIDSDHLDKIADAIKVIRGKDRKQAEPPAKVLSATPRRATKRITETPLEMPRVFS